MDESLKSLYDEPEWPGDKILAIQVKTQLLMSQHDLSYCTWPFGDSLYAAGPSGPSESHISMLLQQTSSLMAEIVQREPGKLSRVVMSRFDCVKLLLNESLLCERDDPSLMSSMRRIERRSACIESIKSWLGFILSTPIDELVGFTFMDMCALAYNLLVLFRFTTAGSGQDANIIRHEVDIIHAVKTLSEMYERAIQSMSTSCCEGTSH